MPVVLNGTANLNPVMLRLLNLLPIPFSASPIQRQYLNQYNARAMQQQRNFAAAIEQGRRANADAWASAEQIMSNKLGVKTPASAKDVVDKIASWQGPLSSEQKEALNLFASHQAKIAVTECRNVVDAMQLYSAPCYPAITAVNNAASSRLAQDQKRIADEQAKTLICYMLPSICAVRLTML